MDCFDDCANLFKLIGYFERPDGFRLSPGSVPASDAILRAFDFFLLKIECQLLEGIMTIVSRGWPSVSWLEIIESRQNTVGDTDVCAQTILELHRRKNPTVSWNLGDRLDDSEQRHLPEVCAQTTLELNRKKNPTVSWNVGGRLEAELDEEEKRHLHELLLDFDVAGDVDERFGIATSMDRMETTEKKGDLHTVDFQLVRPFSDSNVQSLKQFAYQTLDRTQPATDHLVSRVPTWIHQNGLRDEETMPSKECPKCKMLIKENAVLCFYCNYYFSR